MRKVHCIDVSKMPEEELCKILKIKYIPWYKSTLFWSLCIVFCFPSIIVLINLLG